MAYLEAEELNKKDPAAVVDKLSGGFLVVEHAGDMDGEVVENLSKAMEFKTNRLTVILEDLKPGIWELEEKYHGMEQDAGYMRLRAQTEEGEQADVLEQYLLYARGKGLYYVPEDGMEHPLLCPEVIMKSRTCDSGRRSNVTHTCLIETLQDKKRLCRLDNPSLLQGAVLWRLRRRPPVIPRLHIRSF